MGIYDKSGLDVGSFESFVQPETAAGLGSMLGGVGSIVSGALPLAMGVGAIGGMFGDEGKMDVSKAVSGGTFLSGDITTGKSESTVIIIVAIVLGLLIIFTRKKK